MRTMISDILAQAGFEVVGEAETGVQAVDKYKQLKPDLGTMEIVMPDMGGIDAVREITKFDPDAEILVCSALGRQALVVGAIPAHRMETLLDHLRRGAAGRRAGDDVLQLLFRATDALEKAIQVSAAGREQDADVAGIVAELDRAVQRFAPDTAPRHAPPSPPAPEVPALALGPGRRVRVTLRPEAPLKGPRALIVLKRAAGLGAVSQVQPQLAALEADEVEGQFSFLLAGPAPADLVVATLAAAGDVEEVRVDDDAAPVARAETGAPLESGKARHIPVGLRRVGGLLDQIG